MTSEHFIIWLAGLLDDPGYPNAPMSDREAKVKINQIRRMLSKHFPVT